MGDAVRSTGIGIGPGPGWRAKTLPEQVSAERREMRTGGTVTWLAGNGTFDSSRLEANSVNGPVDVSGRFLGRRLLYVNMNSLLRSSFTWSRSFAACSNSNRFAASRISFSSLAIYESSSSCERNSGIPSASSTRSM